MGVFLDVCWYSLEVRRLLSWYPLRLDGQAQAGMDGIDLASIGTTAYAGSYT